MTSDDLEYSANLNNLTVICVHLDGLQIQRAVVEPHLGVKIQTKM